MRIILLVVTFLFCTVSMANDNYKTSALYSPGCDEKQLKEIAGNALIKISKQQNWSKDTSGYILTLDLDKMTFMGLTQEMVKKKCFTRQ